MPFAMTFKYIMSNYYHFVQRKKFLSLPAWRQAMKLAIMALSVFLLAACIQIANSSSRGLFRCLCTRWKSEKLSKYRQPGIKANEAPTYLLLQGNECT